MQSTVGVSRWSHACGHHKIPSAFKDLLYIAVIIWLTRWTLWNYIYKLLVLLNFFLGFFCGIWNFFIIIMKYGTIYIVYLTVPIMLVRVLRFNAPIPLTTYLSVILCTYMTFSPFFTFFYFLFFIYSFQSWSKGK